MSNQHPPAWPMYRALVGIGMLCGLLIAIVYIGTAPVIAQNRAEALEAAVFRVLEGAEQRVTFVRAEDGFVVDDEATGPAIHAGYDADGTLVGIAIEASGMGYADLITVLYGYSPAKETIVGFQVLGSMETPGLGDKIAKDPRFLANFEALDVRLDESRQALVNRVTTVKQGTKTESWQVDGITGATISSVAVGEILAASTAEWLPLIAANLSAIEEGVGED
ncbi:MAG: FMN-binding protein [Woeseiaceae bacterium]|nr:FMN-binding protein [Woeseiaceae bacterium]